MESCLFRRQELVILIKAYIITNVSHYIGEIILRFMVCFFKKDEKKVVSVCLGFAQFGRVHFTSTLRPQEACALVTQLSVHIK